MASAVRPTGERAGGGARHWGSFGLLRLLLASLVIVSHVPEIVDGDRHRELANRLFGTTSFGELAVNGFFVISGFLISQSYDNSGSVAAYLLKRATRIYPAFLVASAICLVAVAPLVGGIAVHGPARTAVGEIARAAALFPPVMTGAFAGTFYPYINGAMWTIQYEFACYLLVVLVSAVGLQSRNALFIAAFGLIALSHCVPDQMVAAWRLETMLPFRGGPAELLRLGGLFLSGAAFARWRASLPITPALAAGAFAALCLCLCHPLTGSPGFALFGAYCILACASLLGRYRWPSFVDRHDVSYGVYLYAWPIEKLLLWFLPSRGLLPLGLETWLLALLAGLLSWTLIEKPAIDLSQRLFTRPARIGGRRAGA